MKKCRCGKRYDQTGHNTLCNKCRHAYDKAWRDKRTAQGLPCRGKHNPQKEKEWRREYYKRPDVRKRRAKLMRGYRNDPVLRLRHIARWTLNRNLKLGRIKKEPCMKCGTLKTDGHHSDYAKPLEVIWLCRPCHRLEHARAEGE